MYQDDPSRNVDNNLPQPANADGDAAGVLAVLSDTTPYPAGWAQDPRLNLIPAAWAGAQWRQFWPSARRMIERAIDAVPASDRVFAGRCIHSMIFWADCRDDANSDWFGRFGWPADDEAPQPLGGSALDEMTWGAVPDECSSHDPEFAAAAERLAELDRSYAGFRAELLKLASLVHRYGNPRIWVTPGNDQETLHSAQAYFALPPHPWMADDDGRLCVFHQGRPERVTAEGLRVRLDATGVVRQLHYNPPTILVVAMGLYPAISEKRALLPESAARLIVSCHEWPNLPRLADTVSCATADLVAAWRIRHGDSWVTSAQVGALDVAGIPSDRVQLGRLLATLAERELVERGKRRSAGYAWRLTCDGTV